MANTVITIDGPAGSGKSTAAQLLAARLGFEFLDTGAMYRAVALAVMRAKADFNDYDAVKQLLSQSRFEFSCRGRDMAASLNGSDITQDIRRADVTQNVSKIASLDFVRDKLVTMQRDFAAKAGNIVTEGRDQGTVVFPDASVKIFLVADACERARRRYKQLKEKGAAVEFKQIKKTIEQRDKSDMQRKLSPLKKASDAVELDTTGLDIEGVVSRLLSIVETKTGKNNS